MTPADLIPFTAVLAAAVTALSTLGGIHLANKSSERQLSLRLSHQDAKDQKEALRARLEELYQLVDHWAGDVISHYITYRSVMQGQLSYNQALDITIASESKGNATRMFTLADLYFPKCHDALKEIRASRDQMAEIEGAYRELYRESGPQGNPAHQRALSAEMARFTSAIENYKRELSSYAREV